MRETLTFAEFRELFKKTCLVNGDRVSIVSDSFSNIIYFFNLNSSLHTPKFIDCNNKFFKVRNLVLVIATKPTGSSSIYFVKLEAQSC